MLDRLLRLGQQEQIEDAILYANIILEAIFLEEYAELKGHKLATRIGNLLASNRLEFKKIYKYYKKIYDLRNAIVHGHPDWRQKDFSQLLKKHYKIEDKQIDNMDIYSHPFIEEYVKSDIFWRIGEIFNLILENNYNFPGVFIDSNFIKFK